MQEREISKTIGKISVQEKKQRVIMVPIFKTKKQEKLFAAMASERMSKDVRLKW